MHTYTHLPQIQPQWQYFLSAPGFVAVSTYLDFFFFFKSTSTNKTELPNKGLTPTKGKQSQKQVRSSSSEKFSKFLQIYFQEYEALFPCAVFSKESKLGLKVLPGTSLVVQWLRICLQCRGCGFDLWSGN